MSSSIHVPAGALDGVQLAVVPGDATSGDGGHGDAVNGHAFEDVEIDRVVVSGRTNGALCAAVPHDNISIASHVYAALAWV